MRIEESMTAHHWLMFCRAAGAFVMLYL